jgi:hypothetical protein
MVSPISNIIAKAIADGLGVPETVVWSCGAIGTIAMELYLMVQIHTKTKNTFVFLCGAVMHTIMHHSGLRIGLFSYCILSNEILLEIHYQHCSRRSQIVCYSVGSESPIESLSEIPVVYLQDMIACYLLVAPSSWIEHLTSLLQKVPFAANTTEEGKSNLTKNILLYVLLSIVGSFLIFQIPVDSVSCRDFTHDNFRR